MRIVNSIIFIIAYIIGFVLNMMNDRIFYFSVKFLSLLLRLLDRRRRFDCLSNLEFAYDNKLSLESKLRILNRCYENFAFVLLNALRLLFMDKDKYLSKFRVHGIECIEKFIDKSNFIAVTAHYGDWEATSRFVSSAFPNITLSVVGRSTNFSSINKLMERSRENFGSKFLDKRGVGRRLVKILNNPNNAIGLVIDQNMSYTEGIWVNFFGKDVTHTSIASILSRKYNIPIIFIYTTLSTDYSSYDIYFELLTDAITTSDSKDDIFKMTQMQASFTEKIIRQKPDEWFWFHKRFKSKYDYIYKQYK